MYKFYSKILVQPPGCINKLLLTMKLTVIILITAILQVSATSFAQKVTLSAKEAALVDVFNQIRVQTGYDFLFTASTLQNARPVTIQVKNVELNDVLNQIFKDQKLDYTIRDKAVVISKKEL